jgi:hypothetical protein
MLRWLWRVLVGEPKPAVNLQAPLSEPVEAQLATLRAKMTALETEWADTLDKIQRWTARENARKRRAAARALEGEGSDSPDAPEGLTEAGNGHPVSRKGHLRQLAAQLRR